MIDLHTHSLLSDGYLLPNELVRRAYVNGYTAIGITDHVDFSNYDYIIPRTLNYCRKITSSKITVIPGIEITHVPPKDMKFFVDYARNAGIKLILAHGETIAEPVEKGTNLSAIKAGVTILGHPGIITEEEMRRANKNNVFIEITTRKGHSLTNGLVAKLALKTGAKLVLNTDFHAPEDFVTAEEAEKIALGAGIPANYLKVMRENSMKIVEQCG